MNKEFDFDDIGKKTPYRTPDNFFAAEGDGTYLRRATPETSFTDNVLYCHSGSCNTGRGIVCSVLSPDGRYTCRNFGYVGYRKK